MEKKGRKGVFRENGEETQETIGFFPVFPMDMLQRSSLDWFKGKLTEQPYI